MANNIEGIYMPELIIYNFIKTIQKILKKDFEENLDKSKTLLNSLFEKDRDEKKLQLETYDHLKQAEKILISKGFAVNLGYNTEVSKMGCVHILLPSENSQPTGIGGNDGYQEDLEFDDSFSPIFSQSFSTTYNLLISSENSLEVLMIYNFLKASFLSLHEHLELYGFQNLKMGGNDIQMQQDLVPTNIYHRSLTISFDYEMIIPSFYKTKLAKDFKLTGIILP